MQADISYLNTAPCFFFSCAEDGKLLFVNETLCATLGFQREELIGKKADIIFTLPTRIFYQTHIFPLLKMQKNIAEIFVTLKTKDNKEIPLLLNAENNRHEDKPVTVFVGVLVNNRKQFEDELIAEKKAAEAALNENIALKEIQQQLQQHIKQLDQQMSW